MTPDEFDIIKARWKEESRYRIVAMQPFKIFEVAMKDISYLLNRLEAAEKAAIGFAKIVESYKKLQPKCYYPRHIEIQTVDRQRCPECGDESLI